ncbi:MAG: hypothetical protein DHS20C17_22640 [Cyclobacteriaceae bacterium]|nr:MAG: hypothetical protein DHS20C17_22640 [Cyclobacteriaceae bacterium]
MPNNRYRKRYVFTAAAIGMLLFGIVMISLGSILPDITSKFQLDEAKAGFLLTLLPTGILLGSLVFGPLVDWLSYKRILIAGSLATLVGIEGIVTSETSVFLHLSVFCIGLGGGILNGITNSLVSEISEEDHSANLSLLGVFFGVGALGTPVVLGLLNSVYSFETIFSVLGALIVLPVLYFSMISFPKSVGTMRLPISAGLKMVKDPLILLFGFILFFQSGMEGLTNNWITTYLETVNIEGSTALFILSSFVGAITITRVVLGKVLRIFKPLKVMVLGYLIAFVGGLCLLYGGSHFLIVAGVVGLGVGMASGFPVVLGYIGQLYTHLPGTAFSIVITIALIGNVFANYLMGQVSHYYGTQVLPYFILSSILAALLLLYFTNNKYNTKIN